VQNGQSSVSHTARPLSHCIKIVLTSTPTHHSTLPLPLCDWRAAVGTCVHITTHSRSGNMVIDGGGIISPCPFRTVCAHRVRASLSPTKHSYSGNVVIEGGGTIDGDGDHWYTDKATMNNERPMMLDLLWVDGLTVRDMRIRRPGCASPSLVCKRRHALLHRVLPCSTRLSSGVRSLYHKFAKYKRDCKR
jgi:hypothetical protein